MNNGEKIEGFCGQINVKSGLAGNACEANPVRELQGAVILSRLNGLTNRLSEVTEKICGRCACISATEEEIESFPSDPMPDFLNEINVSIVAANRDVDRLNQLLSRLEI